MEKRHQQKTALILKYAKRRFDGGPEVDLIRSIERQNQNDQLSRMYGGVSHPELAKMETAVSVPVTPEVAAQLENQHGLAPKNSPVWEAVIMGPLQVAIGAVGMLTGVLAIVTFKRAQNEVMLQQAKVVFSDCAKTFQKGLWDTLTTPIRVFKASRRAKA